MTAMGDFFPRRINTHVPNMAYSADVRFGGIGTITIPAMVAAAAAGILSAQSIAVAGTVDEFVSGFDGSQMGKFGRNVTVVASGAATSTVTVHGRDYLGQMMTEQLTLAGAAAVAGKKAFKYIESVDFGATAGTTINLGYGNVLGLPYKINQLDMESVNDAKPGSGGAVVAGLAAGTTQTAITGDPRGTYAPHSSQVPDGAKVHKLTALWDTSNLHGDVHFSA